MIVNEETWSGIPLLHVVEESLQEQQLPVVIFLHGFTSAKEHNLHYAYNMAKQGIRVILPDAHLHGTRDEELDEVQLSLRFWEIILTSIEEVSIIKEELVKKGIVTTEKIGLGGTSMGGITTFGCLTVFDWINAATIMMGTPGYVQFAKAQMAQFERGGFKLPITDEEKRSLLETLSTFDMTKHPQALNNRPIYFWHGQQDTTVPHDPTFNFYNAMKKAYVETPERFVFVSDKMAGHAVSRTGMLESAKWFADYLKD